MGAVAHGWRMPGGHGPSVAVAREFNQADSGMPALHNAVAPHAISSMPMRLQMARAQALRRAAVGKTGGYF